VQIEKESGKIVQVTKLDKTTLKSLRHKIYMNLHETFLPSGYPYSVADGYLRFSLLNNLGMVAITVMSFLST
jgi:hypothetical protein